MRREQRLRDIVFFLDRSMGRNVVANALRAAGAIVEVHDDHFEEDTPDVEWIASVSKRRRVAILRDEAVLKVAGEFDCIVRNHARLVMPDVRKGNAAAWSHTLVECLPKIVRYVAKHDGPYFIRCSLGPNASKPKPHVDLVPRFKRLYRQRTGK